MTAAAPDPRHRAVEIIERALHHYLPAAASLAREIVVRLEAAGLAIHDAPGAGQSGFCEFHQLPRPCHGCAGDAKAKRDDDPARLDPKDTP